MRKLTFLVVFLAALYGGYWFVGARAIENGGRVALAQMQADGWDVRYGDLQTAGFPSRFDTTASDLALTAPDGQFGLRTPFVQVFALSYQPNQVIAVLPNRFAVDLAGVPYRIENTDLRMSGAVQAGIALALTDVTAEAEAVQVTGQGFGLRVAKALAAVRLAAAGPASYDAFVDARGLELDQVAGGWPDQIERLSVDATLAFDRPLDRHALDNAAAAPLLEALELRSLQVVAADITGTVSGAITVDSAGVPTGEMRFRTADWGPLIDMLISAGVIDAGMRRTLRGIAEALAGGDGMLELPLTFRNGRMSAGPLPLGPAPRLR